MAISDQKHQVQSPPSSSSSSSCLLDDASLYCEEERFNDVEEEEFDEVFQSLPPFSTDLFWEDEELLSLFSKEQEQQHQHNFNFNSFETDPSLSLTRQESVQWMLKVNAHYGFSTLTSILAINFLDRFISTPFYQREKPWMIQLVAVTCLSLAAKVEETQVPLLLDFQVEDSKYMFEARTIQRMELLVLSALKWKMHPVTPLSFLHHIIRRLGLNTNHLHWEFLKKCERLLISAVSDSRSIRYLPSVLAAAAMMHVIDQVQHFNPKDYQTQLLHILKTSQEKVRECCGLIDELVVSKNDDAEQRKNRDDSRGSNNGGWNYKKLVSQKRKCYSTMAAAGARRRSSSPSGVIDAFFNGDSSSDSWGLDSSVARPPSSPEAEHLFKKSRTREEDQWMVFVDIVGRTSPR